MNTGTDALLMLEVDGLSWPLHDGDVIGRLGTVARDVLQHHDVLSRHHLRVTREDGRWNLTLLPDAQNLTHLNGTVMLAGLPVALEAPSSLQVVTFTCRLHFGDQPAQSAEHPAALLTLDAMLNVNWHNAEAAHLLGSELQRGTDFLHIFETSSAVRLRHLLGTLRDGQRPEEIEAALPPASTGTGSQAPAARWLAIRAVRAGETLLMAARDVTHERQQHEAVQTATRHLETRVRALTALLTSQPFVEGDLAAGLPLLVDDASRLLESTEVSAWLYEDNKTAPAGKPSADGDRFILTCRAVAGAVDPTNILLARRAAVPARPPRGAVEDGARASWHLSGLIDEAVGSAWLEPMGNEGVLLFRRTGSAHPAWLEPETNLAGLTAALGRQLFANAQRRQAMDAVQAREAAFSAELSDAAQYVEKRLPPLITKGPVTVDWVFQPCGRLGGDMLGYEWLDRERFAIYIADVMGHGSKAALHALSLAQTLKLLLSRGGPDSDDPARWLAALNAEFPMAQHQGLLWTMWCGIFHTGTRELCYASGGHPPALLLHGDSCRALSTDGPVLGALAEAGYRSEKARLQEDARLFLYTDGVYEFPTATEAAGSLEDFAAAVAGVEGMEQGECAFLRARAAALCVEPEFPDDFTIVRARFAR